jgi:hypothetical protein
MNAEKNSGPQIAAGIDEGRAPKGDILLRYGQMEFLHHPFDEAVGIRHAGDLLFRRWLVGG